MGEEFTVLGGAEPPVATYEPLNEADLRAYLKTAGGTGGEYVSVDFKGVLEEAGKTGKNQSVFANLMFYASNLERSILCLTNNAVNHFEACQNLLRALMECGKLCAYMCEHPDEVIPVALSEEEHRQKLAEGLKIIKGLYPQAGRLFGWLSDYAHIGSEGRTSSVVYHAAAAGRGKAMLSHKRKNNWTKRELDLVFSTLTFLMEVLRVGIHGFLSNQ